MENTNKRKTGSLRVLIAALLCLIVPYMASAQQAVTVQGRVTDAENQPLIGVSVLVKGTTTGVSTGIDGDYTITAPADGTLEFAFLGLKTQDIEIGSRSIINVVMEEDKTSIDEVVVVGYGVQKRGSVTGAVAGVKGSEMIQTKNENPQNMLAGRVAGLRVWQKSSEPGTFSNSFDIRGMGSPLVIIDGIPRTTEEFQRLNPNDIEDVSVLKDASAAIYGVRAANGVVLVTTKQGREGQAKVSYNGSFTFQVPSKMPKLANAYEAMTLYNEQSMNKVDGGSIIYTEDDFEAFRNGTRRTTDWNSLLFSDFSPQTQHDISISGGTEKTKYYVSMGYFYQEGFFPSVSAGWRISEEPFIKNSDFFSFIDQLKLRASYGVLGDDGDLQYDWATGYTYPSTSGNAEKGYYNQYAPGYIFGGEFVYAATPLALPNENITWYTSHTFNIGVDFEGWNGLFGFSLDYFNRYRKGMFARRSGDLPTVVGASAPRENLDSDRQFGLELELTHRNRIGEFAYNIKAIATITRNKYLTASEKGPWGNSYDRWRNDNLTHRYQGIQFGYESAGRYESWEDIWSYNIYKDRDVLPGDYKYVDWNGDGEINSLDEHPFAFDQTPWMNFSLSFDATYRNFDLSLLFQGSALGSMEYKEPLYSIWGSNGGGTLEQYLDRWHPVDPNADPYDPETEWVEGYYGYTGHYPKSNSEFNRVSTSYLRLKSIEIGYTLPKFKRVSTMSLRVYANAYNLFTITGVKFVDPEHPDDDLGRMYPLNRTYTLGLSLSF